MYHPRLKGSHYDMGYHYGSLLLQNGVSFDSLLQLTQEQKNFGRASLAVCEALIPELCQEIKGLSAGLQVSYEAFASWLLCLYGFGDAHGCTCFCFHAAGKTVLARNSDMFPSLKPTSESILYRPDKNYILLGHSTAMVSLEDGINEHGLAAGMTFLQTKTAKPGLHAGFLIRLILETCRTVEEALSLLKTLPVSSTQNLVFADRDGGMAVAEVSPDRLAVRIASAEEPFLIAANHFIKEEMQKEHANPVSNWYRSAERYETARQALSSASKNRDVPYAQDILSGRLGFLCQYEKNLNFDTIWSVIYDLQDLRIFRAEGNPSRTRYQEDARLQWGIRKKQ